MTPSEFKAWFEGFTESMDGPPSLKQWERIQARVKQITGTPTSYPVFVDRYWPQPNQPWWLREPGRLVTNTYSTNGTARAREGVNYTTLNAGHCNRDIGNVAFDSHSAMNALGKADAASLAA